MIQIFTDVNIVQRFEPIVSRMVDGQHMDAVLHSQIMHSHRLIAGNTCMHSRGFHTLQCTGVEPNYTLS